MGRRGALGPLVLAAALTLSLVLLAPNSQPAPPAAPVPAVAPSTGSSWYSCSAQGDLAPCAVSGPQTSDYGAFAISAGDGSVGPRIFGDTMTPALLGDQLDGEAVWNASLTNGSVSPVYFSSDAFGDAAVVAFTQPGPAPEILDEGYCVGADEPYCYNSFNAIDLGSLDITTGGAVVFFLEISGLTSGGPACPTPISPAYMVGCVPATSSAYGLAVAAQNISAGTVSIDGGFEEAGGWAVNGSLGPGLSWFLANPGVGPLPSSQAESLTFVESGLPSGSQWCATFDYLTNCATTSSINFPYFGGGTFHWNVSSTQFYTPSPSSGDVEAGTTIINVAFSDSAYIQALPFIGGVAIVIGSSSLGTVNETLFVYPSGDCGSSLITAVSALDPTPLPWQEPVGAQELTFTATQSSTYGTFTVSEGAPAPNCFAGLVWANETTSFLVFTNATPESGTPTGLIIPSFSTNFYEHWLFANDTSTVTNDSIASIAWNFGDGSYGTGSDVSHLYTADGNYTVTETVTDIHGKTYVATALLQVRSNEIYGGTPPPPFGLYVSAQGQSWGVVNWTNPNATGLAGDVTFLSFFIDGDCVQYFQISAFPSDYVFSSYNFTGLSNQTQYCVSVLDYNTTGNSTLAVPTYIFPLAPFDLTVLGQTTSSVELAWANVPGLDVWAVQVYYGTACGTWKSVIIDSATTLANVTGLSQSTTYCFTVQDQYLATNGSLTWTPTAYPFVRDTTSGVPSGGGGGGGGGSPAPGGGGSGTQPIVTQTAVSGFPFWLVGLILAFVGAVLVLLKRWSGIALVAVGILIVALTYSSFGTWPDFSGVAL